MHTNPKFGSRCHIYLQKDEQAVSAGGALRLVGLWEPCQVETAHKRLDVMDASNTSVLSAQAVSFLSSNDKGLCMVHNLQPGSPFFGIHCLDSLKL